MSAKTFTVTNTGTAQTSITTITFNTPAGIQHTADLTNFGGPSNFTGTTFSSNTIIPLTRLCIKLVFLSGGRVKIQYGDKKSISEPLIRQEATNQNIVFKKSIAQYGKPLCPPVLSINLFSSSFLNLF